MFLFPSPNGGERLGSVYKIGEWIEEITELSVREQLCQHQPPSSNTEDWRGGEACLKTSKAHLNFNDN